jgi:endonuclease YncB( thermonuclease family)
MRRFFSLMMIIAILAASIWLEYHWSNSDKKVPVVMSDGTIKAIDGDSFHLGAQEVRLFAIDAPEAQQNCQDAMGNAYPCGKEAAKILNVMLKEDGLKCEETARDKYGRMVARCSTLTTADIGEAMVHMGWAVALTFTKKTEYADAERRASEAGRGIWQGEFMRPSDWRNRPNDRT